MDYVRHCDIVFEHFSLSVVYKFKNCTNIKDKILIFFKFYVGIIILLYNKQ
jgi:hypothetical protein